MKPIWCEQEFIIVMLVLYFLQDGTRVMVQHYSLLFNLSVSLYFINEC